MVEFRLYDVVKEISLLDFCEICKVPFGGRLDGPCREDVEGFIDMIAVGEIRQVAGARITSITSLFCATLLYLLVGV